MGVEKQAAASTEAIIGSALRPESEFCATLLAMAGHDLRQPLQVILNSFSKLARCNMQGPELEYIHRGELAACRLAEHLDHLVEALYLYGRAPVIALEPVRIGPLLAAACQEHVDFAEQKGLRFRFCPRDVTVMSDAMLLKGALGNLVGNALKYTPSGGKVLVGCRQRGSIARIEVHDTGIGIPKDHLSKVFDAFHRVSSTRPDGLGLGLFIVRRTVNLLGHRIEVSSSEGHGTCFSVLAEVAAAACASDIVRHRCDTASVDLRGLSASRPLPMHRALVAVGY